MLPFCRRPPLKGEIVMLLPSWIQTRVGASPLMSTWGRRRTRRNRRVPRRPAVEQLETRAVRSVNFGMAFNVGGAGDDIGQCIATDAAGNLCVAGTFQGTADMDPGPGQVLLTATPGTGSAFDGFVAKYSAAGSLLWAQRMGGPMDDFAFAIAADVAGNTYVAGEYSGTGDFGSN